MAAGLSMAKENFEAFRDRFDAVVAGQLKGERPIPHIYYDAELNFDQITPKFYRILNQFAPFGPENMKPIFFTRGVQDHSGTRQVGAEKTHLKLQVKQDKNDQAIFDGIGFDMGGIQSMSRATFAKLCPAGEKDTASYFSFYDVCDRLSTVLGTFIFGLIIQLTGNMRNGILVLGVVFMLSLYFLVKIIRSKSNSLILG
jgi:hypothetical protein